MLEDSPSYLPGRPGISPGFHSFQLNDFGDGKTIVTILMEHASYAEDGSMTDDEALAPWRAGPGPEGVRKWHEDFIPELKRLVHEGS